VPTLRPETAKTWTIGLVLEPTAVKNLSVTLDYYNITVEDSITNIGASIILNACYGSNLPQYCALVQRNPATQQITNIIDLNHRQFTSPGQGYWPEVSPEQWNSWQWQMQHSVKSLAQLEGKIELTGEEHAGVLLANTKLAMGITPYFFNLIDPFDPECPIRRQVMRCL